MSQPVALFTHKETTKEERAILGKTKEEVEEIQHEFSQMSGSLSASPMEFEKKRMGATYVEWAWKGDNMILHTGWTIPMVVNKRAVCRGFINIMYPLVPKDVDVTIKAPFHEMEGGAYTIILGAMKLRPGAEVFVREKLVPSLLRYNPSQGIPSGPVSR